MNLVRFRFALKTLEPLAHTHPGAPQAERTNMMPIRATVMYVNGAPVRIPTLSANHVRSRMRRDLVKDFLDLLGISPVDYATTTRKQFAIDALFRGTSLSKKGDSEESSHLDLERVSQVRSHLPPVSLFGMLAPGCSVEGLLRVGYIFPACVETEPLVPWKPNDPFAFSIPAHELTEQVHYTKSPLGEEVPISIPARRERTGREYDVGQSPLPYAIEVIRPLTWLIGELWLTITNTVDPELVKSALGRAVRLLQEDPRFGLRSNAGHGLCEVFCDPLPDDTYYVEWVNRNSERIRDYIENTFPLMFPTGNGQGG
jgi:hypothetical protein